MVKNISFNANPIINTAQFIENRVFINKALVDISIDAPMVIMANNSDERRERLSKAAIVWGIAFATPFVTLPLTNRLALKYIAKTYKSFLSKENNIIQISNKNLSTVEGFKKNLSEIAKKYKFDVASLVEKAGGYDILRKKLIDSKMAVLGFDYLFTAGLAGSIGYFNNYMTKKKTGKEGFSAEFNMADSAIVKKRAKNFEKSEKIRKASFIGLLLSLTLSPLLIRKGLLKNGQKGFFNKIKNIAEKFDYDNGILMRRLPMFITTMVAYYGVASASRNSTEMKDSLVRSLVANTIFFGGDIVMGSCLARLSDKLFKTNLLDKNPRKNLINKILPSYKPIRNLKGRDKSFATAIFFLNMAFLSGVIGFGVPKLLNKMIKKDVQKDVSSNYKEANTLNNLHNSEVFKNFKL